MKTFWCVAIFFLSASAEVKRIHEFPEWWAERDLEQSQVIDFKTRNARVFGGQEATPNRLPYQVGLLLFLKNSVDVGFCSGSLITTTRVVTGAWKLFLKSKQKSNFFFFAAAHCVDVVVGMQAIFGAHLIDRFETSQTRMSIALKNLVYHANYSSKTLRNDIAMISLPTPVVLSSIIKVINLPSGDDLTRDFVGEKVRISGWGRFSASMVLSKSLRYVDVSVITNDACLFHFPTKFQDTNSEKIKTKPRKFI